jgi:hypothetical protein
MQANRRSGLDRFAHGAIILVALASPILRGIRLRMPPIPQNPPEVRALLVRWRHGDAGAMADEQTTLPVERT